MPENPFDLETTKPLIALMGDRNGYLQIAPTVSEHSTRYQGMTSEALLAARSWAIQLETRGAERVYWITLSEVVRHLHIHLYPRWASDTLKGVPLFEQRDQAPQPEWTTGVLEALEQWAKEHHVYVLQR